MILDDLIVGLFSIVLALLDAAMFVCVPVVNLFAVIAEAIVGLFVSGFKLGRLKRKEREKPTEKPKSAWAHAGTIIGRTVFCAALLVFFWILGSPALLNRSITFVADDGHSLPFAGVVIQTSDGDQIHRRTDNAGNIEVPRFGLAEVQLKDARYVEQSWSGDEIEPVLEAQRTVLGSSLDVLKDKLLAPAKEREE